MDRSVWTINNKHFTLILDAKTESGKVSDRKFSPGEDIWTNEIPQLKFEDENTVFDAEDKAKKEAQSIAKDGEANVASLKEKAMANVDDAASTIVKNVL